MLARLIFAGAILSCVSARAGDLRLISHTPCTLVHLGVDERGQVTWNKAPVGNLSALEAKLAQAQSITPDICFNLIPSAGAFDRLMPLVMLIQKHGFRVAFTVKPPPS